MYKAMQKILVAILCLLLANSINAQLISGCGFKIPKQSLRSNFKSVYEATDIVNLMIDSIQWKENFILKEQNGINNAYATIMNRARYIVYDNHFLESLDMTAGTKWASISVLAHEVGHHFYNHVVSSKGSNINSELEADLFCGFVLQRLGSTLEQAKAAMTQIGTDRATTTHPAKNDRLKAITKGWEDAKTKFGEVKLPTGGGVANGGTTTPPPVVTNPPVTTNPKPPVNTNPIPGNTGTTPPNTSTDPNTDPSWIALFIQSNKEEKVLLSDDGKNYQEAAIPQGQPFVFKFEIYNFGYLKLKYYNGYRVFKLFHGKDYNILWNRRTKNWTVTEIPE
jgi:hypothetical protein